MTMHSDFFILENYFRAVVLPGALFSCEPGFICLSLKFFFFFV